MASDEACDLSLADTWRIAGRIKGAPFLQDRVRRLRHKFLSNRNIEIVTGDIILFLRLRLDAN